MPVMAHRLVLSRGYGSSVTGEDRIREFWRRYRFRWRNGRKNKMTIVVILLGAFLINYLLDACFRSLWAKNLRYGYSFRISLPWKERRLG